MISGYLQTEQTECYDDAGNIIPCAGTGQDAAYRAGIVWPNPRFAWTLYTDDGNLGVPQPQPITQRRVHPMSP